MTKHKDTSRSGDLVVAMKDQIESWEFEDPREIWWKWQHQYAQAADLIETQAREIKRLRERVKQLNEGWDAMGTKGQAIIDRLSAENARLRDALNQVLLHRYGDWTDIARAALAGDSHD